MDAIRAERIAKNFGPVAAVDGLTFSVGEGEIFGLVGPDGAGKTTTMRLLTSIMNPTSGDAWVLGHHVVKDAAAVKERIGYMSQRFGLYADLTVMENLTFYADIFDVPVKGRAETFDRLLSFSNLTPFRKRLAGDLSGGMKQKLGLACTLVHTPQVLFLDEPTNGVDPVSRRDFWKILYQLLREGVTIFVSTAYLDEAERCSRLGLIDGGKLLALGTPDDVKKLMRGTILELRPLEPRQVARALRNRLGRQSVGLFGDRVHIIADDPERASREAAKALADAGLPPSDVRQVEPTLEDVFVSVLAGREQGAPSGAEAGGAGAGEERTGPRTTSPSAGHVAGSPAAAQAGEKAVVVRDLVKKFGSFVAVNRVSFDVAKGEVFGFLGPNGAGKSTTIRMLCGILAPTSGSGMVAGFHVGPDSEKIKSVIGYMSQKFSLYEDLSVEENLDFYAGIYGLSDEKRRERKEWVLAMAGLLERRNARTAVLSGGWKQRLALGSAILHEPSIIFLDEPTSGVDPVSRRRFWDLIYELSSRGVTTFVTTHYMDEAEYCDRIGLIYRGELIAIGAPGVLKTDYMKEDVLEVVCERPQDAMAVVETIEGVTEAALFGKALHIVAADSREVARRIPQRLRDEGLACGRVERIEPSLEDVFVSLIEAHDRAEAPQAEVGR